MDNILKITSGRYSMDWYDYTNHELNIDNIAYFTVDYRGGKDWHIIVTEKPKNDEWFSYDLGHWVGTDEVIKLINDERVIIKGINNSHNSPKFMKMATKLFKNEK